MNHFAHHTRDALNEWLDAQARGDTPLHSVDDQDLESLQTAASWLQARAHSGDQYVISTSARPREWEKIMQTHLTTPNASHISRPDTPRMFSAVAPTSSGSRIARAVVRWQPAVSLSIVVAFLISLMGIAYQRGILDQPPPTESLPTLGLATTPDDLYQCLSHGPLRRSATDLERMNLGYWSVPEYTAARLATTEEGQAVVDAFVGWNQCMLYQIAENEGRPPESLSSYYSDRWRYISLAPTFAESRNEEIQAFHTRINEVEAIVRNAPLPIGVPQTFGFDGARFVPQQVYQLTDGRFAVIFGPIEGTLTMTSLMESSGQSSSAYLDFMAFMEVGGKMYLDEHQVIPISAIRGGGGGAMLGLTRGARETGVSRARCLVH